MRRLLIAALLLAFACGDDVPNDESTPRIEFEPRFLEFGVIEFGERRTLQATLKNSTPAALTLDGRVDETPGFTEAFGLDWVKTVAPVDGEVNVNVVFDPPATGEFRGSVTVRPSGDRVAPQTLSAHGFAYERTLSVKTASIAFGNGVVGTEVRRTFDVTNETDTMQRVSFGGRRVRNCADMTDVSEFCHLAALSLAARETRAVEIRFVPRKAGIVSTSNLEIRTCDAAVCTATVELSGLAVEAATACTAGILAFPRTTPGECSSATFRCDNTANVAVRFEDIRIVEDVGGDVFSVDDAGSRTLAPGESYRSFIDFCPPAPGDYRATFVIRTNEVSRSHVNHTISLRGES